METSERRSDLRLRTQVDKLRNYLGREISKPALFTQTITSLTLMSGSEFGFICDIVVENQSGPSIKEYIGVGIEAARLAPTQLRMQTINEDNGLRLVRDLLGDSLHSGRIRMLNQGIDEHLAQLFPSYQDKIRNLIAIPLLDSFQCYGMVVLINRLNGFDRELYKRLWPLIATSNCIYRSQQYHLPQLQQTESMPNAFALDELTKLRFVSHNAIVTLDKSYRIVAFNPAAEKIFGVTSEQVLQTKFEELVPANYPNFHLVSGIGNSACKPEYSPATEHHVTGIHANGTELYLKYTQYVTNYAGEKQITFVFQNQTELQQLQAHKVNAIQRFKAVADLAPVGILQVDQEWNTVYVNGSWCEVTGLTAEEMEGHGWVNAIHRDDVVQCMDELQSCIRNNEEYSNELRFQSPLGQVMWAKLNVRPIYDVEGNVDGFIATCADITPLRMTEMKLRTMAEMDSLTGLSNRARFLQHLNEAMFRAVRRGKIALLFLDLDGFKHINDALGHEAGDKLLIEVATRIRSCVRREDIVARLGGDEFTIILEAIYDPRFVAETAQKIIKSISKPVFIDHHEVFVSTCAGIAISDEHTIDEPEALLRQADVALFKAKAEGRSSYQYYTPEMTESAQIRLRITNELHHAAENDEFAVFYQPQISIQDNTVIGYEALLRWQKGETEMPGPAIIVPILEETRLIVNVGQWVLQTACAQHAALIKQGAMSESSTVSVNLSAQQFYKGDIVRTVQRVLEETSLPGANLVLEITESMFLQDEQRYTAALHAFREMGIHVSLDDFGTGYSSLNYLTRLPIDQIKIDQSFLRNIFSQPKNATISQSIIDVGHKLKMKVVGEGVDSTEKLTFLTQSGCDAYQGYLFSKPLPVERLQAQLLTTA